MNESEKYLHAKYLQYVLYDGTGDLRQGADGEFMARATFIITTVHLTHFIDVIPPVLSLVLPLPVAWVREFKSKPIKMWCAPKIYLQFKYRLEIGSNISAS